MANASRKHMGPASQGKGDGTGALTEVSKEMIPESGILSNRDKSRHSEDRGLDSKQVQTEQLQENPANRMPDE